MTFDEFAYGNDAFPFFRGKFIIPGKREEIFFQIGIEVSRLIISIHSSELGGTGTDDFDEGKTFIGERILDGFYQGVNVKDGETGDITGAGAFDQFTEVEGGFGVAEGAGGSAAIQGGGGGQLPAGHTVNRIIGGDNGDIDIAAGGVDEVVAADGGEVAVAGNHHYGKLGILDFRAGGERDGSAVHSVQGIGGEMRTGNPGGAANAGDEEHLTEIQAEVIDRPEGGAQYDSVSTASAEGGREDFRPQVFL